MVRLLSRCGGGVPSLRAVSYKSASQPLGTWGPLLLWGELVELLAFFCPRAPGAQHEILRPHPRRSVGAAERRRVASSSKTRGRPRETFPACVNWQRCPCKACLSRAWHVSSIAPSVATCTCQFGWFGFRLLSVIPHADLPRPWISDPARKAGHVSSGLVLHKGMAGLQSSCQKRQGAQGSPNNLLTKQPQHHLHQQSTVPGRILRPVCSKIATETTLEPTHGVRAT